MTNSIGTLSTNRCIFARADRLVWVDNSDYAVKDVGRVERSVWRLGIGILRSVAAKSGLDSQAYISGLAGLI
jgi:hypothetical protein